MASARPLLGGRYRLLDVIGEGGMAVVYRARDELLDRDVAVKVLREQYARDEDFVRRFRQEARNAAALAHPNIAPVFDTGVDGETEYIVMQLVDGPDLETVLTLRGRLSVAEALRIGVATAEALDAAHGRGIVHRDIKPGNILLTSEGEVRVVDFGIARALGDSRTTNPGLLLGSVQYCSPEQVLGEPIEPASDIYSLGVVLYELLTGRRLWDGPSPAAVALARLHEPPVPPSDIAPDLPEGIDELVLRALERDPANRFRSGRDLADAIRDWWRAHRRATAQDPRQVVSRRRGRATEATPIPARLAPAAAGAVAGAWDLPRGRIGDLTTARPRPGRRGAPPVVPPPHSPPPADLGADAEQPVDAPSWRDERDRRRPVPAWLVPVGAALLLAVAVAVLSDGFRGAGSGVLGATGTPAPTGTLAAIASASSAPTATIVPTASPTPSPSPTASPTPTPTASPAPTPTPAPTRAPTPRPTAAPTPRPTTPPPPPPAVTGPGESVARFYFLINEERYDEAAALWTAEMRNRYPPNEYIDGRFSRTERIVVNRNELVALNEDGGTAVVAVTLTEYLTTGEVRRIVGSWDLVRVNGVWLLADPDLAFQ